MKRTILLPLLIAAAAAQANDSTGFVETGGIQYLKNPHIEMQREDLYISQQQIRVSYTFKNNSAQDITETVLFPLPEIPATPDGDFADTAGLINSFRIWADGKAVKPQIHVLAFFEAKDGKKLDMTAKLKQCGLSDIELMAPWTNKYDHEKVSAKINACLTPQAAKLKLKSDDDISNLWSTQIVYSWKQTFKAGKTTEIKHQYTPLLGGSFLIPPAEPEKYTRACQCSGRYSDKCGSADGTIQAARLCSRMVWRSLARRWAAGFMSCSFLRARRLGGGLDGWRSRLKAGFWVFRRPVRFGWFV